MIRVLLIGKRAAVLIKLQAALRDIGIDADLTQDVTDADRRQWGEYTAVAFGGAVRADVRVRMKAAFQAVSPSVVFVDGLAPITPLLVAQIEQALDRRPERDRRIGDVVTFDDRMEFALRAPAHVRVTTYRLTLLHRARTTHLLDERLDAGVHRVDLNVPLVWARAAFAVLRADAEVRVVAVRR